MEVVRQRDARKRIVDGGASKAMMLLSSASSTEYGRLPTKSVEDGAMGPCSEGEAYSGHTAEVENALARERTRGVDVVAATRLMARVESARQTTRRACVRSALASMLWVGTDGGRGYTGAVK